MAGGLRGAVALALVGVMLLTAAVPAHADAGSFLYSRKFYGALSLASSAFFFKEAYDAKRDANRNYDAYKTAGNATQATTLYNEAKRGDTRMTVMLGLGVGTLAYGIYMFLDKGGDDLNPKGKKDQQVSFKGVGLDVQGDVQSRAVKLQLNRKF